MFTFPQVSLKKFFGGYICLNWDPKCGRCVWVFYNLQSPFPPPLPPSQTIYLPFFFFFFFFGFRSLLLVTLIHLKWWFEMIIKFTLVIQMILLRAPRTWRWCFNSGVSLYFIFDRIQVNRYDFYSEVTALGLFSLAQVFLSLGSKCTSIGLTL